MMKEHSFPPRVCEFIIDEAPSVLSLVPSPLSDHSFAIDLYCAECSEVADAALALSPLLVTLGFACAAGGVRRKGFSVHKLKFALRKSGTVIVLLLT